MIENIVSNGLQKSPKTLWRNKLKRKQPTKVKKTPIPKSPGSAIIPSKTFHETFPITLEFMEGKDFKRCFFVCKEHCESYLKRYKLKKDSYKVFDTKPKNEEKQ